MAGPLTIARSPARRPAAPRASPHQRRARARRRSEPSFLALSTPVDRDAAVPV
jgi:hypothetical protein